MKSLEQTKNDAFEPPPVEWLSHKVGKVQKVLEQKTEKSALLLRKLVGKVTLTPKVPEVGKPYYHARSRLKSFALLEGRGNRKDSKEGSNWGQWWRWRH